MDIRKFKSQMSLRGESCKTVADALGICLPTLSKKLHGRACFTQGEIQIIKVRWNLSPDELDSIFFAAEQSCQDPCDE